ncbi:MAG: hypothetical protein D6772_02570 [Bacteroidetes bacterium]|nr:MAG: hypothetical protein D6772_02570 [Bacteroidota bacterium]
MIRLLFILFLGIGSLGLARTQTLTKAERVARTEQAIQALQSGGLIVRLSTQVRKIAALEERLADPRLSVSQRERITKMRSATQTESEAINRLLVRMMREKYHLSELYFLPDTAFSMLGEANSQTVFLNDDLELDPTIGPPQGDFLIMHIGYSDPSNTARAEGFILMDSALEPIPAPFPSVIAFNNMGFAINSLLAPELAERRKIERAVERLVKKLEKLLEK